MSPSLPLIGEANLYRPPLSVMSILAQGNEKTVLGRIAMSNASNSSETSSYFYNKGVHYYVAARFSVLSRLRTISGNLFHHALEMLLKGKLAETYTLQQLKAKFNHRLVRIWEEFKLLFPKENLVAYDEMIANLGRFEDLRYPDVMIEKGGVVAIAWGGSKLPASSKSKEGGGQYYRFSMDEMDCLVAKIIDLCSNEPLSFMLLLHEDARRILQKHNKACHDWFSME
jgi:hypothetical protein